MKNLETDLLETKDWENSRDWWDDIMAAYRNNDPDEVEHFIQNRPKGKNGEFEKMPGEDELFDWLVATFSEKYGESRKPLVRFNEKGILISVISEEKK